VTYLVAYDGSPPSRKALEWAARRAKAEGARLRIVTAIPESLQDSFFSTMLLPSLDLTQVVPTGTFEQNARRRLEELAKENGLSGAEIGVLKGEAWHAIVEDAKRTKPDALVLGVKSYEKVGEFQLGATAERVVRHAPCTVVIVR